MRRERGVDREVENVVDEVGEAVVNKESQENQGNRERSSKLMLFTFT